MSNFLKDYGKLCKDTGKFYKDHLFGVVVMIAVIIGAEFAWWKRDDIKDFVEDKFRKEDKELD